MRTMKRQEQLNSDDTFVEENDEGNTPMRTQEILNDTLRLMLSDYLQTETGGRWLGEGVVKKVYRHRFIVEFDDATYIVKVTKKQVVR